MDVEIHLKNLRWVLIYFVSIYGHFPAIRFLQNYFFGSISTFKE